MKTFIQSFFILLSLHTYSQSSSHSIYKKDSSGMIQSLVKGKFSGQARYFFMATDNQKGLSDYYANAVGAYLKYETDSFKKFTLAVSASAVYNVFSSDLTQMDATTKKPNRYEIGFFDLSHPEKKSIYRMEELYVQYSLSKGFIRLGRQLLNTPFINPQDGRMRPTFANGLWTKLTFSSTQIEAGVLTGILPRSIGYWQSVASSIGLYPQGINQDGSASNYAHQLSSKGILLTGLTQPLSHSIKLKLWNLFAENIFNTTLLQIDMERTNKEQIKWLASFQYILQQQVNDGGNKDASKSYFQSAAPAQVISAMTGLKAKHWKVSVNFTRIFKGARFLMPKEWGIEPFFTFMPRERNEGFGDVNAFVIKTAYNIPQFYLQVWVQAGHFQLPDVKNTILNKYGMPSYNQLNAGLKYMPAFAKGIDSQFLYVFKKNAGNIYQNPAFVFNKVNMSLYNLVLNYTW